ncbi:LysE family translocator [Cohaesibacter gelatinilyticus]|uniref:Resistance to homoserine/threonine (RhtB) family protein n=1 Tax=Cohaesibacter gelatinilyticus TaxID=372072 RepID=A0A285PN97_9HYPH|nr:LysE family translocator [Cohaesibacter gelatinilyticus]SNZ21606.1 resistance to homoserine/threonine (RhtB) family protein [Cohaesibacter gelatinilyticus]
MDYAASISAIIIVNILAWITPGPNMLAVISASLGSGRRHGLATGLGLSCGATIWAILAVFGIVVLFELFPAMVQILKFSGAVYLIWLGVKALRARAKELETLASDAKNENSLWGAFKTGLLVSLTNPKAAFFFGSILTAFIPTNAPSWFLGVIVLLCLLLAICLHSITATFFSTAIVLRTFSGFRRKMNAAFGMLFVGMGLISAYSVIRNGVAS